MLKLSAYSIWPDDELLQPDPSGATLLLWKIHQHFLCPYRFQTQRKPVYEQNTV